MWRTSRGRRPAGALLFLAALAFTPALAYAQSDTPTPVDFASTPTPSPLAETATLPPLNARITASPAFTNAAANIDPTLVATLEQVLLASAAQQIQAYALRDASPLTSTSTTDYFQWISQTLRQSMDLGVTGANLDALRWSGIALTSPTTASLSDRENWTIRYADDSTSTQESRWIYALVFDSDMTWKIQSATPVLEQG